MRERPGVSTSNSLPGVSRSPASPPERDLSHRSGRVFFLALPGASGLRRFRGATHARSETMTGADKVVCQAATLLLLFTLTTVPAKAHFGGFGGGGGGDMMTQMAPMLEMMKAKMGKRRFGAMMQTMGPMMSRMMENGAAGLAECSAAEPPAVSAVEILTACSAAPVA